MSAASKRFRLIDDGYPTFKKIVTGKKWVGRVCKRVDGDYLGIIGKTVFAAPTEDEAFEEVVARHLGYANAAGLQGRNAIVRQQNKAHKAEVRETVNRYLSATTTSERFEVLDSLFARMKRNME